MVIIVYLYTCIKSHWTLPLQWLNFMTKLYFNKAVLKRYLIMLARVLIKKECWIVISAGKCGKTLHLVRGYGIFRKVNNCSQGNLFRKFWAILLKRNVQLLVYIISMPTVSLEVSLAINSIHPFSKSHRVLTSLPTITCQIGGG